MRVLLSIRPEFAAGIFDGSKKYEYRRAIFKRPGVTKIVVYASGSVKRIIGEFEIGPVLHDKPHALWAKTKEHAGISRKEFFQYFRDKAKGYAIQVGATRKYDTPFPLSQLMVATAPQSFMYLP
ncbi:MAG: hypothetical protein V3S10_04550 [Dehalococcoidales bacterium]